jgi:hypothetical protein
MAVSVGWSRFPVENRKSKHTHMFIMSMAVSRD